MHIHKVKKTSEKNKLERSRYSLQITFSDAMIRAVSGAE